MNFLQLIASSNFIALNKDLMKILGLYEAIVLGELASEYDYWYRNNGIDEEGYFYSTVENVEQNTTLSKYKQTTAFNTLKKEKIIDVKIKGIPAKRYVRINEEQVIKKLDIKLPRNLTTRSQKINQLDVKKLDTNNNIINNNIINNNIINKKEKIYKKENFKKPTIEEINAYCIERNNGINANKFYDFYESKGWMIGKNKMKDWKACVRTWEQKNKKENNVPSWFDKEIESKSLNENEKNELENILSDYKE